MEYVNLINEFWDHIENSRGQTLTNKVYNWLNKDNLGSINIDGKIFWLELTCSYSTLPKYAFNYIKKFMKKKGYTYLYEKYPA